jgi:hypothetical protein
LRSLRLQAISDCPKSPLATALLPKAFSALLYRGLESSVNE